MRRRAWLRRLLAAAALAALAVVTVAAIAAGRYPGVTSRLVDHARAASFAESRGLFGCILYWAHFMEKLRPDPETGIYGFATPQAYGDTGLEVCKTLWHRGEFGRAAGCLETAMETGGESEDGLFWLGMSRLRLAELENCLPALRGVEGGHRGGRSVCTLPLAPHHRSTAASRATDAFGRILDHHHPGDPLTRWLLTFSTMAAGTWPEAVPAHHRIDSPFLDRFYGAEAERLRRRYRHLRFTDRAADLGVAVEDSGRGVAVEDFDGDGWLDLVVAGAFEHLRYFRNRGGRGFEEVTADSGLAGVVQPFAVSAADFDGDGWMDLFVARPFHHHELFRNLGGGRFRRVTEESGLRRPGDDRLSATWSSAWGDVDLDGDLDLFLAQWGMDLPFVGGLLARERIDSKLYLNDGGRFTDATAAYGLAELVHDEYFVGATFGDYDGDGWPDLFLSSPVRGASVLLANRGGRRFQPVPLPRSESGFYAGWLDVDHDGRLDIFQGGFGDARTSTRQAVFGHGRGRWESGHSTILRQTAAGGFEERNDFFGAAAAPMATMGAGWGDLDNDGCHDFYLGTGNPEGWFVLPNLLYVGLRDGRRCTGAMEEASVVGGFANVQKGHGVVFFDFDGDGDQDVYSALGGMWPADTWPNQFFVNDGDLDRAWTGIRLHGRRSDRFGVGARLRVEAEAADGSPIVRTATISNGTGFGSSPYLAHVGLLDAVRLTGVEVFWPASGCRHRYAARLGEVNLLDEADCLAAVPEKARAAADDETPCDPHTPGPVPRGEPCVT